MSEEDPTIHVMFSQDELTKLLLHHSGADDRSAVLFRVINGQIVASVFGNRRRKQAPQPQRGSE